MSFLKKKWNQENSLFRNAILLSLLFHLGLFGSFYLGKIFGKYSSHSALEIDLTKPFRIGGNPLLRPGGGILTTPPKKEGVPKAAEESPKEDQKTAPPKDWVLPGPATQELEKPLPEKPPDIKGAPGGIPEGTGDGYMGTGGGVGGGDGEGGGIPLSKFPRLLNRKEILKLLRRYYPVAEREAGREGVVVVDLHLDVNGNVISADIIDSGGVSFDEVAQMVAKKMRFSPAVMDTTPVAVKIRQSITFKIED